MTSSGSNPGDPPNLRKACDACHTAKIRCVPSTEGSPCQRCARLAITCKFSPPETGVKRKRKKTSSASDGSDNFRGGTRDHSRSLFNDSISILYPSLNLGEGLIPSSSITTQILHDDYCFQDLPDFEATEGMWPSLPTPAYNASPMSSSTPQPVNSLVDNMLNYPPFRQSQPIQINDDKTHSDNGTVSQSTPVNSPHFARLAQALATMQSDTCSILRVGEALQILGSVVVVLDTMGAPTTSCAQDFSGPSLIMLIFSIAYMALGVHDKILTSSAEEANALEGLTGFGATFSHAETAQIRSALLSGQLRTLSGIAGSINDTAKKRHHGPEFCVVQEMANRLRHMIDATEKRLKANELV